ncbi:hypothetical protein BDU57DRAFT_512585 [Ampelomyces quisqualis]|uniref:Uncharacterized protein n=1 Tax=Ampelomyces quisqualis TaxID=50730 RepID=A0A6A5R027_AMPQU|nr:hypothetical protein BDU57DRAFT_512585 [Ampelomyces quisqualis]
MSDYGDDDSDYGDEWMYIEDEYMAADDLAEHTIASPPPTTYGDDDVQADWDRFDYFNDLEYASDGYDDATAVPHGSRDAKTGQKRKRAARGSRSKKKPRGAAGVAQAINPLVTAHSPVVWRAQHERGPKLKQLADDAQSFALLKDWRDKLADTPHWARASAPARSPSAPSRNAFAADAPDLLAPATGLLDDEALDEGDEEMDEGGDVDISQDALMAALQRQLAAAGGPLSGMDPQQLLQFAMRMMTEKDAGDDIAGEMADAMLGGEEGDEGHEEAGSQDNLLSWVAQQRNANKDAAATEPNSPEATRDSKRPPTPPSSEANRSIKAAENKTKSGGAKSKTWTAQETTPAASLKRKADDGDEPESSTKTIKKRVTNSFDAPTAASQAKAAPARQTRATRSKR